MRYKVPVCRFWDSDPPQIYDNDLEAKWILCIQSCYIPCITQYQSWTILPASYVYTVSIWFKWHPKLFFIFSTLPKNDAVKIDCWPVLSITVCDERGKLKLLITSTELCATPTGSLRGKTIFLGVKYRLHIVININKVNKKAVLFRPIFKWLAQFQVS